MTPTTAALATTSPAESRTAMHRARAGYGAATETTASPREQQRDVFIRSVHALRRARAEDDPAATARTLCDNEKLWMHIASESADPGSPLPPDMRANLVSLASFVLGQTERARRDPAALDALIEINHRMAAGLMQTGPDAAGRGE